jgi:hypothetical protein
MGRMYQNNKTKNEYVIGPKEVINTTNAQDGQAMIIYMDKDGQHFVREKEEFFSKFTKITKFK